MRRPGWGEEVMEEATEKRECAQSLSLSLAWSPQHKAMGVQA